MKLAPDLLEVKHWIYPLNKAKRDYQYNIVKHCLFDNTLVALPTGLGKTFIAGVVMLNCTFVCFTLCSRNVEIYQSTVGSLRERSFLSHRLNPWLLNKSPHVMKLVVSRLLTALS